jgi:hypothetical protein
MQESVKGYFRPPKMHLLVVDFVRSVMDAMDEDTILFVLGDHGMTMSGDHGGDSLDELNAALFVLNVRIRCVHFCCFHSLHKFHYLYK